MNERAGFLFSGVGGLHDLGLAGEGVVVGIVDCDVTATDVTPRVCYGSTSVSPPAQSRQPGHGDATARAVLHAAPQARLAVANVEDRNGDVLRAPIAAAIPELADTGLVDVLNVSLWLRRRPEVCTLDRPCDACRAITRVVAERDLIVTAAAGNLGALGVTCPGAARGAIGVAATTGPAGESNHDGLELTSTGTSISAAGVAGGSALLACAFHGLGAAELKTALAATATRLPGAPREAVGHGEAHYYRSFRYIQHVRAGGIADEARAQAAVDHVRPDWEREIRDLPTGSPRYVRIAEASQEALTYAPWSATLVHMRALLEERASSADALGSALDAIRLDWSLPGPHRLVSRILEGRDDRRGAAVEAEIAGLLAANQQLEAADTLFAGLLALSSADLGRSS